MAGFWDWLSAVVLWSMLTVGAGMAVLAFITGDGTAFFVLLLVAAAGYWGIERRLE